MDTKSASLPRGNQTLPYDPSRGAFMVMVKGKQVAMPAETAYSHTEACVGGEFSMKRTVLEWAPLFLRTYVHGYANDRSPVERCAIMEKSSLGKQG